MQFRIIDEKDFDRINEVLSTVEYNGCEFSKVYLQNWPYYNYKTMEFYDDGRTIFLRFKALEKYYEDEIDFDHVYLPPLTSLDNIKNAVEAIEQECITTNTRMLIVGCPQEYVDRLDAEKYVLDNKRQYDEYLYLPADLVELSGKKYHSKRNHIKRFNAKYEYVFRDYEEKDKKNVLILCDDWKDTKGGNEEFVADEYEEYDLIKSALDHVVFKDKYHASVIEIEGKIVGFSFVEITASNVGIMHIEKADTQYEGIYSALCNMMATKYLKDVRIINRQEDMGIEGLRKSKLSYYPVGFCNKYAVWDKN